MTLPLNRKTAEPNSHTAKHARQDPRRKGRGKLWSALSVVLATLGFTQSGPMSAADATLGMRHLVALGDAANTQISYLKNGSEKGPLLILVHGTPGSAQGWSDYLVSPPSDTEVIALDRPGFGASGPVGALTNLQDQAAAVVALLPTTERPVVLLGHSLGGPIVAWVAAHYPTRISAVVLLAASMDPAEEKIHPMQWVGTWPVVRSLLPRAIRNSNAELIALKSELERLEKILPDIRAKVIIVHGTKDDLVPVANVAYMQARLTGTRCTKTLLLEGRNHFLPWNSPEVVREAISQALDQAC